MLAISRMKSVLNPSYLAKPTAAAAIFPLPLRFQSLQNPIFFHSRIPGPTMVPSKNPSFLLNPTKIGHFSPHLKPSQNPCHRVTIRSLNSEAAALSYSPPGSGEIHVIVGPMFAGKTTTLLRRIKTECSNGRSVAVIKSNKDSRYALDSIVTHDWEKWPCWPLANLSSFREKLGSEAYGKLEVIGIDEAQFFEDLYDFCRKAADLDGKTVIVAGLDGDYLRRKFGSVLEIIPLADSVTKLTARCEVCGERAFFTLRKTEETETELIGGTEVYMPVCRKHYVSGQVVKEVLATPKVEGMCFDRTRWRNMIHITDPT